MMIQDIEPKRFYNRYEPNTTAADGDSVLIFEGGTVACRLENGIAFPKIKDLSDAGRRQLIYLFRIDEERFFLGQTPCPEGYAMHSLREMREQIAENRYLLFAAFTGRHLNDWYRDSTFCGRCGGRMTHSDKERAMTCPGCGYTAYPRIMPAVIVGVKNGNKLLITRYRTGFNHNALVAGFTEIGETLEQTVAREVAEETGVRVKNIRYYKSQPWGTANDILMGFWCEADGETVIRMDQSELKYAEWVDRDQIELQPDSTSLTNEMMQRFRDGLEQ